MKLLILSESPLQKVGDDYYAMDPWIRIPRYFSDQCEQVTVLAPVSETDSGSKPLPGSWKIDLGKMRLAPLDYYVRYIDYYRLLPRRFFRWIRQVDSLVRSHDVVIVRAPSPMGPIVVQRAVRQKKPLVYMILLNLSTQSDRLLSSRGIKRMIISGLIYALLRLEKRAVKKASLVYVYSQELARRYAGCTDRLKLVQDPHLVSKDIVRREDTCQSSEIRLLRVCWLILSKGLEHLLEAVALLRARGLPVKLEVVGQERAPGYRQALEDLIKRLRIEDHVTLTGWVPFDRIGEVYLRNDIQVISSLGEGTPRCIVEGFARGLPLVCTSVGGCKDILAHEREALLVPPASPAAIADAVERISKDGGLRREMIRRGYAIAESVTFEQLGFQVLEDIGRLAAAYGNSRGSEKITSASDEYLFEDHRMCDWQFYLSLQSHADVLILGGGHGVVPLTFAETCRSVTVVDWDPAKIDRIRQRQEKQGVQNLRTLHLPNGLDLPFPDHAFDMVSFRDLRAVGVPVSFRDLVLLAKRLLKPGGVAHFQIGNRWSPLRFFEKRKKGGYGNLHALSGCQNVLRREKFRDLQAFAPLPYFDGVPLFFVPIQESRAFSYFLRNSFPLFEMVSPETKKAYSLEYMLARWGVSLGNFLGLGRMARFLVSGYMILARNGS